MEMLKNTVWHTQFLTKAERRQKNKHHSAVLFFTGLSGSGKSTIANLAAQHLFELGIHTTVLDGDNLRQGLNRDLDFSKEARKENIRRLGEVSKLFIDSGHIVFTAFIAPFREDRDTVKNLLDSDEFVEVFVDCPLDVCESRDPKGLYKKARTSKIMHFTGISSPYEAPLNPDMTLLTNYYSVEECVEQIIGYLRERKWI